jgi:tetratricopeptide (TPR) repeat protein
LLGKYKSSLEVAKEAYRINSNDYEIFYILGKISLALGDREGALAYFKGSIGK